MRKGLLFAMLVAAIPSSPTWGQNRATLPSALYGWFGEREPWGRSEPMATDRPDFTEASSTVGKDVTQIEMGYTYQHAVDGETHSLGEPLLRHGMLANWLEFRVAARPISIQQTNGDSGFEDLYVGAKLGLTRQRGILPELAVVPQATLPTGSSAFTSGEALYGVNMLYGWDVTDKYSLGASTQYNQTIVDQRERGDKWAQSATIGHALSDDIGCYFEWFVIVAEMPGELQHRNFLDGGMTLLLTQDVQLDLRFGHGVGNAIDEWFAGLGLSFRFR